MSGTWSPSHLHAQRFVPLVCSQTSAVNGTQHHHMRTNGNWEALGSAARGATAGGVAGLGEDAKGLRQAVPQAAAGVVCVGAAPRVRHALRVDMRAEHHLQGAHSGGVRSIGTCMQVCGKECRKALAWST